MGFVAAAMGGLGFGISAPIGLRMALPERPVVAVIGDGAALYSIQVLWSAARYEAGVLYVVLNNGGYRVMDRLAEGAGEPAPWPSFDSIDLSAIARAQGCDARRITTHSELTAALDEVLPGLAERRSPLLLEAMVAADPTFLV
jgi:benzoylformate decarboxylase